MKTNEELLNEWIDKSTKPIEIHEVLNLMDKARMEGFNIGFQKGIYW